MIQIPYLTLFYFCSLMAIPSAAIMYTVASFSNIPVAMLITGGFIFAQAAMIERAVRYVGLTRYMKVRQTNGLLVLENKPSQIKERK
jgi:hypothetical protein